MMITTIIFDFAGVLGTRLTPLFAKLLQEELGYDEDCVIGTWEMRNQALDKGSLSEKEFWAFFEKRMGIPSPDYFYKEKFLSCVEPDPEMVKLAKRLKQNGYTIGLLSNICPSAGEKIKRMPSLQGLFDVRILSYEIGEVKPEPVKEKYSTEELRIYDVAERELKKHGVPIPTPDAILFIDDKDGPCDSARQYGWIAVKYEYDMAKLVHDLRAYGVRV